jgi:ubiquitin-protein ligase
MFVTGVGHFYPRAKLILVRVLALASLSERTLRHTTCLKIMDDFVDLTGNDGYASTEIDSDIEETPQVEDLDGTVPTAIDDVSVVVQGKRNDVEQFSRSSSKINRKRSKNNTKKVVVWDLEDSENIVVDLTAEEAGGQGQSDRVLKRSRLGPSASSSSSSSAAAAAATALKVVWDDSDDDNAKIASSSSSSSSAVGEAVAGLSEQDKDMYVKSMTELVFETVGSFGNKSRLASPEVVIKHMRLLRQQLRDSLYWASGIFFRIAEDNTGDMQFVIAGTDDTPYQNGLFHFNMTLPSNYPSSPPECKIVSTHSGQIRMNPNLYADGKVCLSLLGTWQGPGWSAQSNLCQVVLALQAQVMHNYPLCNEPSFEGTSASSIEFYNLLIRCNTMQVGMLDALTNPPRAFEAMVLAYFTGRKRVEIARQVVLWANEARDYRNSTTLRPNDAALRYGLDETGLFKSLRSTLRGPVVQYYGGGGRGRGRGRGGRGGRGGGGGGGGGGGNGLGNIKDGISTITSRLAREVLRALGMEAQFEPFIN